MVIKFTNNKVYKLPNGSEISMHKLKKGKNMLNHKKFDYTDEALKNSEKTKTLLKIRLYTMLGEYVHTVKVLPLIVRMPEIITWGQRTFVLREDGNYYEAFNFYVLPENYTENL